MKPSSNRSEVRALVSDQIASDYSALPEVESIVMAGSQTSGSADSGSDIDLYVYSRNEIPMASREMIARARSDRNETNNRFWEPGDEWEERDTGIHVDVMFRSCEWIESQLQRVLVRHEASVGYSTCFWYNVLSSRILLDRNGWFSAFQQWADQPYPEPLRRAIVARNYPILRQNMSSYHYQLKKALERNDPVSLNHRTAVFLASYFDILFAINRIPHPGEKRLLSFVQQQCAIIPDQMEEDVRTFITSASTANPQLSSCVELLVDRLTAVLQEQDLLSEGGNSDHRKESQSR